jgi:hypothetical protein
MKTLEVVTAQLRKTVDDVVDFGFALQLRRASHVVPVTAGPNPA